MSYAQNMDGDRVRITKKTLDNLEVGDELMNDTGRITIKSIDTLFIAEYSGGLRASYTRDQLNSFGYVPAPTTTITIKNKTYREADVLKALEGLEEIK